MRTSAYDAIIVGGGHNGLVCGAYLAKAGLNVLLLEQRHILGGACVTEELFPGYRFSTCSFLCHLLQKKVIDDLNLRVHGFHMYPLDPQELHLFPGNKGLLVWNSTERTQEAISRFSTRDADAYPRWVAFWERAARVIHPYLLTPPPTLPELWAKLRGTPDEDFVNMLITASMKDVITEFFDHQAIRGAFTRVEDVGDPTVPGGAWCMAYIRCSMLNDVGIVKGGMGAITQAMAASARSHGVTLRTAAAVERILVEGNRAIGVRLADGTEIRSSLVASNADPKRTFLQLLRPDDLPGGFRERVKRLKTQAGYLKFHAALNRLPDLSRYIGGEVDWRHAARMRICPSMEYYERSWNDARQKRPPTRPVLHVNIPSGYDTTMAPAGKHTISVLSFYAPVQLAEGTWDNRRAEVAEQLIDVLAEYLPDIRDCLGDWLLLTPPDVEQRLGLTDGNIRHLDIVPSQYLAKRPMSDWAQYRTPMKNLYLCGAGTHPGGEVTGAPGHNAAQAMLVDYVS